MNKKLYAKSTGALQDNASNQTSAQVVAQAPSQADAKKRADAPAPIIRVQEAPFDPGKELSKFSKANPRMGAISSFVGLVRASDAGTQTQLILEHYAGFTDAEIGKVAYAAQQQFAVEDILIIHRFGSMMVGEPIVLVLVASAHRAAAFEATEYIMDYLKTDAPFWKLEKTPTGTHWIEPTDLDRTRRTSHSKETS